MNLTQGPGENREVKLIWGRMSHKLCGGEHKVEEELREMKCCMNHDGFIVGLYRDTKKLLLLESIINIYLSFNLG